MIFNEALVRFRTYGAKVNRCFKNPNVPMIVFLVTFIGLSGNCSRAAVMAIFTVCDLPPWMGVPLQRMMTDNATLAYRSQAHRAMVRSLGALHVLTRPYRPRPNGKAERFINTVLAGVVVPPPLSHVGSADHRAPALPAAL